MALNLADPCFFKWSCTSGVTWVSSISEVYQQPLVSSDSRDAICPSMHQMKKPNKGLHKVERPKIVS